MNRSIVLKRTKFLFLFLSLFSLGIAIHVARFFGGDDLEAFVRRQVNMAILKGVSVRAIEHPFIPFEQIVFTGIEIESQGLDFDAATLRVENSFFSLLRLLIFDGGKLNIAAYDANVALGGGTAAEQASSIPNASVILDILSSFDFDVTAGNVNLEFDDGLTSSSVRDLSFSLSVRKGFSLEKLRMSFEQFFFSRPSDELLISASHAYSTQDNAARISVVNVSSAAFSMSQDKLDFEWSLPNGADLFLPSLRFAFWGVPVSLDGLAISFGSKRKDGFGAAVSLDQARVLVADNVFLEAKRTRAELTLWQGFRFLSLYGDADIDASFSGRSAFSGPASFRVDESGTFSLSSSSFRFPPLGMECLLQLTASTGGGLNIGITSEDSQTLHADFVFDPLLRSITASAEFGIGDLSIPPALLSHISEKRHAKASFSTNLATGESLLDFDWAISAFNEDVFLRFSFESDPDSVRIWGDGLEIAGLKIAPPSQSIPKNENIAVSLPVSFLDRRVTDVEIRYEGGSLGVDAATDGGGFRFSGKLDDFENEKRLDALIALFGEEYKFSCLFSGTGLSIHGDRVQAGIRFADPFSAHLFANELVLPDIICNLRRTALTNDNAPSGSQNAFDERIPNYIVANIGFSISVDRGLQTITMPESFFSFSFPRSSLRWKMDYDGKKFNLRDFLYASPEWSLSGGGYVGGDFFSVGFLMGMDCSMRFQSGDGNFSAGVFFSSDKRSGSGRLYVRMDKLAKFGAVNGLDADLEVSIGPDADFSADGDIQISLLNETQKNRIGVSAKKGSLSFYCDDFRYGCLRLEKAYAQADLKAGTAALSCSVFYDYPRLDKTVRFAFSPQAKIWWNLSKGAAGILRPSEIIERAQIAIGDISMDYEPFDSLECEISVSNGMLRFEKGFVTGYADLLHGDFSLRANAPFAIQGLFEGKVAEGKALIRSRVDHLPISLIRHFIARPVFVISSGDFHGDAVLLLGENDFELFCKLSADEMRIWNFWTENEHITINNLNLIGNGHDLSLLRTTATSVNKSSSKISFFETEAGVSFDILSEPVWHVNVYVPEDQSVESNIPLVNFDYNVNVKGASGNFYLVGRGMDFIEITGDFFADNVLFSQPMQAPEYIFGSDDGSGSLQVPKTDVKVSVRTGRNVRFTYPDDQRPILNVFLKEGQQVGIEYSDSQGGVFRLGNKVELATGDAYYLSRRFRIESGDMSWDGKRSVSAGPVFNLRVSYRDRDKAAGGISLYADIKGATLDDLKLELSSSQALNESDVLVRFGQTVVQTDTSLGSLQYLASLSTTMIDFFSGLSRTSQLASSISLSDDVGVGLGLDEFTFQTSVLSNFLSDAVPSLLNQRTISGGSAFSKYLDGTSLYLSKRVRDDLTLSASAELVSSYEGPDRPYGIQLGGDLTCLMTFGAEWELEPFCLTLFSRPQDLSVPGLLSGIGFGFSRSMLF